MYKLKYYYIIWYILDLFIKIIKREWSNRLISFSMGISK